MTIDDLLASSDNIDGLLESSGSSCEEISDLAVPLTSVNQNKTIESGIHTASDYDQPAARLPQPFPFLKLDLALRLMVYDVLLGASDELIDVYSTTLGSFNMFSRFYLLQM